MQRVSGVIAILAGLMLSSTSRAAYTSVATGTLTLIQQQTTAAGFTAGTFLFQISARTTVTGCGARGGFFVVSSNSIPDLQTRLSILALLMNAYSTGTQVSVAYDDTGGFLRSDWDWRVLHKRALRRMALS